MHNDCRSLFLGFDSLVSLDPVRILFNYIGLIR